MPFQIEGIVAAVSTQIGRKRYERNFYVQTEAVSDCLLGLDFLETNKCDAFFSEIKQKIDENTLVPFYRKQFSFDEKQIFRVVALERNSIPQKYVFVVPGTVPGWKTSPVVRVALFEPHERFINIEKQIAQDALFTIEKGIAITIDKSQDEILTINKDTTLDSSQLVSNRLIQELNRKQTQKLEWGGPQVRLGESKESNKSRHYH